MPPPAITFNRLTKRYGKARGVDDLDLEVPNGEVFGFLGPNGAGKTTTIRVLLDLLRPTSGSVRVLGMDSRSDGVAIRSRIGYLPGELSLHEGFTGRQTLDHFARMRSGVDTSFQRELVDRFDVDLDRKVSDLSTGNKQKLGIIEAISHRPDLLVFDEPTTGLDPLLQQVAHDLILEARSEGRTVFLSSHILPEVERVADRVGIIRDGRLLAVSSIDDLKARAIRVMEVRFAEGTAAADGLQRIPGVREVEIVGDVVRFRVEGAMDTLVKALATRDVITLRSEEADLEEIFLAMYRGEIA